MADGYPGAFRTPNAAASGFSASRDGRRLRSWRYSNAGPNSVMAYSIGTILGRARDAARNDPWAGTALDKLTSNGIGTGIQAKGLFGSKAHRKRERALWRRWCKACDADGVLDFYGLQALAWRECHEAGEVFVRLRRRKETDGLPVPLQLQLIEAEQCPADYFGTAPNGNEIRMGIELDGIGRRVAYWMYRKHPGEYVQRTIGSELLIRVPAQEVLHIYEPLRAGQLRGLPRATSVLVRMFNLDSMDDAVLERQRLANLFGGFFTTSREDEDEYTQGASPVEQIATGTDGDGTLIGGLEPGTMVELPPGMEPKFSDPPQVGQEYGQYLRTHLLAISARHCVPYEVLTGDLKDVSDRALRLILNEFRRVIEMWQWLMFIPKFCQPAREAYLDAAVLAGVLDIPGYAEARDDAGETLWVPQGWPYSHPVQDVDADIKATRAGFTSRSGIVLANGEDPDEVDQQQAADNERADRLGLTYESDARQKKTAAKPQNGDPEDDKQ